MITSDFDNSKIFLILEHVINGTSPPHRPAGSPPAPADPRAYGIKRNGRRSGAGEHGRAQLRAVPGAVPRQQSGKDLYHACRRADSIVRRGVHGKSALRHPG